MARLSTVEIVGGGPAGLYTAVLLRRMIPNVSVRVTEQNPVGATFGFGVVFSDQALDFLSAVDPTIHELVVPRMERWQNMTLNLPKGQVTIDGVGFSSIGRLELIEILRVVALSVGVTTRFSTTLTSLEGLQADLIVGADGLNSLIRRSDEASFRPSLDYLTNRFAWFGADRPFETLTQTFVETERGPFNAHHYRFSPTQSTFIVECNSATFAGYGLEGRGEDESARICERIFADVLDGARLTTNKSTWRQFPRLWCEKWVSGRHVILGDAAHTAHFSIGSGTRLALEDANALVSALSAHGDVDEALSVFQAERLPIARKIVDASNMSAQWYEDFGAKLSLPPLDFAYDYMTRSGRIDMVRLRKLAPEFASAYELAREQETPALIDPVRDDAPSAIEINFVKSDHPNCSSILWDNLARAPDRLALTGPGGDLTYAELIAEAARWGNAFKGAALERGARIAFVLDDTPALCAAFFGAVRAGFVPVLLNIQTRPDDLNYFLQDSGARIALIDAVLVATLGEDVFAGTRLEKIVVTNGTAEGTRNIGAANFMASHATSLDCADTKPDDMALWMYSSGSTGRPKGIVHLHHDVAYIQEAFGKNVLQLSPDDRCFSVPKMYFAYGFGNAMVFPFSVGATTILLAGQPRPAAVLDTIEKYRPSVLFGLPTLYTALANSEGIEKRDLSSLTRSMSAAEVLSKEIYTVWKDLTGHGPTEGLGSTEILHIYLSNTHDDQRLGAAGARVPGYEVRLERPDGSPTADGEEGVMLVRGHSSAPCYWNRPDKTRETMRGDWIFTGDRFVKKDGYYYFQGRTDDLIKVSGQWVWPLEVERCLNDHPDVMECAVLPHKLEDERMTLRAVVALKQNREGSDAQSELLRGYVKSKLAPYKYPRIVEYVSSLPKTGTGKIDRQALIK